MLPQIKFFFKKVDEFTEISSIIKDAKSNCIINYTYGKNNIHIRIKAKKYYYRIMLDGVVKVDWTPTDKGKNDTNEYDLEVNRKYSEVACNLYCNYDTSIDIQLKDILSGREYSEIRLPNYNLEERKKARAKSLKKVSRLYLKRIRLFITGKITKNNNKIEESRAILRANYDSELTTRISFNRDNLAKYNTAPTHSDNNSLIILPVYNSLELLKKCIQRVVKHTRNYKLLIIEDCSTDKEVKPYLKTLKRIYPDAPIKTIYNKENLGFIGTVNRGLSEAVEKETSVVILNSDAFVPNDKWLEKLMHPINESPLKVASVTPLSNAATIMTAPYICSDHAIGDEEIEVMNRAASTLSPMYTYPIPTGIGFCMAMNIHFIKLNPEFDRAFGSGYGEEVDWCQKAVVNGGTNLGVTNLFVAHVGGQSFGSETKRKAIQSSGKIISSRYPLFDAQVQEFISMDPFSLARVVTGIHLQGFRKGSTKVYIGHNTGGGAESYLEREVKMAGEDHSVIVLRPCERTCWKVQLMDGAQMTSCSIDDNETVIEILKDTPNLEVIYSCGVGHPNPLAIPQLLSSIKASLNCKTKILYHDFYPITSSYNLLNKNNVYNLTDVVSEAGTTEWSKLWAECHRTSDKIVTFSVNTKNIVAAVYPEVISKIIVKPHDTSYIIPAPRKDKTKRNSEQFTIGVMGGINIAKGGVVIQELSKYYSGSEEGTRIVIIGEVKPSLTITKPSVIHGRYNLEHINDLIDKYEIDMWLFPSIWPETFSYVTHECIATNLPVMCFDIGAPADIIKNYAVGTILSYDYTNVKYSNIRSLATEIKASI